MNRLIVYFLCLIFLFPEIKSQDVTVTAAFDSSRMYIGDQIHFRISIDQPSGISLTLPFFRDTIIKNIEILSGPFVDSTNQNGRTKIIESYLITSFDSGHYQVPPVYAEIRNENGLKRYYSDYSRLEVVRVNIAPADTTAQIYDIIEPYGAPVTFGEIIPWILLAVFAGLVIWYAVRHFRKSKKPVKEVEVVINTEPAHVIAFRELEKLRDEQLWQKGEVKFYYSKLTEILRQYLENRFRIFSLEMTTSETLDVLIKSGFKKGDSYNQLRSVLTGADLVKFAKYKPDSSENEAHFQNAWDFVSSTRIEEPPVSEKSGEKDREGQL